MARPIQPTPILEGEDARRFLREMKKPSTDKEKAYLKRCDQAYEKYPFGE
jgi:hypothetical protein